MQTRLFVMNGNIMGSLYDNSGEDIYARRDIEKRRKHAMAMKKKENVRY